MLLSGGSFLYQGDTAAELYSPFDVATTKQSCLNKGWRQVRRADGTTFRNQRECIGYLRKGSD